MAKIILIGGAEDRKDKKETLRKIVDVCSGGTIGICTSALYDNPLELFDVYKDSFENIGVDKVVSFDIRSKDEVDIVENIKNLDLIDAIFFTGGDQVRLAEIFNHTNFLKKLKSKINSEQIVYCGSSAGSMIAAETMIYDGDYKGLVKGSVGSGQGFGIVKNVIVDTHFFKRARLERMAQVLLRGGENKGIGLTENSGIVIIENICEVVGKGCVAFVDASNIVTNIYESVSEGDKIPVIGLNITLLNSGDKFCLWNWSPIF